MDKWMANERAKGERRSKIVPSSTEQITDDGSDPGLAAMDAIARWLAEHPEVPLVELAAISRDNITLGLLEPAQLPEPFEVSGDTSESSDTWKITISDALELAGDDDYGYQTTALTAIGNKADGSRILLNVSRWQIFGIVGTEDWARAALVGQIMVQATESWSRDQDLWLVGLGETARKLIHFLSKYHPEHRFHVAESLSEISAEMLEGTSATLYVAGADQSTYLQFKALQNPHVGLLTDDVVTNEAMFMSEGDDGSAVIAPINVSVFPNVAWDLIEAMDIAWSEYLKLEEQAEVETKDLDYDELLSAEEPGDAPVSTQAAADVDAAFTEIMATAGLADAQPEPEQGAGEADTASDEEGPDTDNRASSEPGTPRPLTIHLLGTVRVTGPAGELTGRNAEAVALLHLNGQPTPAQQISAALWPSDDSEGHTARTRRSRLLTKIRGMVPTAEATDDGWTIGTVSTDVNEIDHLFATTPLEDEAKLIAACEVVNPALVDAGPWAEVQRTEIAQRLIAALDGLIDRALNDDAYGVVKAARAAMKRAGE